MSLPSITPAAPVILTGDRTTGPLHLGHYLGSLRTRVELQHTHRQFLLLADAQAMTDNVGKHQKVTDNVIEVALDYLAAGIDPDKSTIFIQSQVIELAELTQYLMNLVTVARLERNPTIKQEIVPAWLRARYSRGLPGLSRSARPPTSRRSRRPWCRWATTSCR